MPVGDQTLGRLWNVIGDPVDNSEVEEGGERWPIHRDPPEDYRELSPTTEIFETGMKVIDLVAPSCAAARSASSAAPGWARPC